MTEHPISNQRNTALPIDEILPQILLSLEEHNSLIIQAPPGAGKSTKVPLALLDSQWFKAAPQNQQIWLLEPRRLAAQQVAQRMADTLSEPLGQTVGLLTGQQTKLGAHTRLVVMTEAILTQKLLADEDIPNCSALLFDEFHERNLYSDLGLALSHECQQLLRDDLRIIVMSATLATETLKAKLGAPVLTSQGRSYPVTTEYLGSANSQRRRLEEHVSWAVSKALTNEQGHILVFLPGMSEIRRTQNLLEEKGLPEHILVFPLHGQLPPEEQRKALMPLPESSSLRKVILATSVAETSLTIEGVRVVIDSGVERNTRYNPRTAMDQLTTLPASQASADQRQGRAGRQQAGTCYRLWSKDSHSSREAFSSADILTMDLSGFALTLACWGSLQLEDYLLLDQPNPQRWQSALSLLSDLTAITEDGHVTKHGQAMAKLGLIPRLAHMLISAEKIDQAPLACLIAAIISEGAPIRFDHGNSDLSDCIDLLTQSISSGIPKRFRHGQVQYGKTQRIIQQSRKLAAQMQCSIEQAIKQDTIDNHQTGRILISAYPDRVGQKRGQGHRLTNGLGVQCLPEDPMGQSEWLVVADIQSSQGKQNWIQLAAAVSESDLRTELPHQISERIRVEINEKGHLTGYKSETLGQLVLKETRFNPTHEEIQTGLLNHVRDKGLNTLDWSEDDQQLRARMAWAHQLEPSLFPDASDHKLMETLESWLQPYMTGKSLKNLPLRDALLAIIPWDLQPQFNKSYPEKLLLPSGRHAKVDYQQDPPQIKTKLQECFGLTESPTIGRGLQAVQLALLSPAQKPLALTMDLPHFWQNVYPEVRKEMRGRYPKHPWPENPMEAQATAKTKRHLNSE